MSADKINDFFKSHLNGCSGVQRQTAVTAYFTSKQLLLFAYARQRWNQGQEISAPGLVLQIAWNHPRDGFEPR